MDAARVYERYLRAKIRAEQLSCLALASDDLLRKSKDRDRLLGGRLTAFNDSSPMSFMPIPVPVSRAKPDSCPCNAPPHPTCPEKLSNEKEPAAAKELVREEKRKDDSDKEKNQQKPKAKNKYICKCKLPVIVVPSKRSIEKGSSSKTRFKCCLFREKEVPKKMPQECPKAPEVAPKEIPRCPSTRSLPPDNAAPISNPTRNSSPNPNPTPSPTPNPTPSTKSKESAKSVRYQSKQTETDKIKCAECEKIPEITQELCALKKKLEKQIEEEIDQKQKLNTMNDQLKQLCECVKGLSDKYKYFETAKETLRKEPPKEPPKDPSKEPKPSPADNCQKKNTTTNKGDIPLERKASSLCEFCRNKDLPIIDTMQFSLFKIMGKRCFEDITLTILLRADNIYHVNVRDIGSGTVLGCLLVTDAGIKEANSLGLFQEILTFCVIDVRNTINTNGSVLGGINFEFVHEQRLTGGNALGGHAQRQTFEEEVRRSELYDSDYYQTDAQGSNDLDYCPIETEASELQTEDNDEFQPEVRFDSKFSINNVAKSGRCVTRTFSVASSASRRKSRLKKRKPRISVSDVIRKINTYSSSMVLTDTETKYPVRNLCITSQLDYSSHSEYDDDDLPTTAKQMKF